MDSQNGTSDAQSWFDEIENMLDIYEACLIKASQKETRMLEKMRNFSKKHGLNEPDSNIFRIIEEAMIGFYRIFHKVSKIKEKVNRKTIKISIFGKVSVGKSKILNTLLHHDLFMSATSHTTSCFVKISMSNRQDHYVTYENKTEFFSRLEDLQMKVEELSTDLEETNANKLETSASVEVFLNIRNNKILRQNTQIVDSPGSSNKDEITKCIETESLDADIFIFVMSHALTSLEIDFFRFQSKESSKPDIFILINGWDNSDNDNKIATEKSRQSIMRDLLSFLTSEGGLRADEARKRIYFVSANEMFRQRINKENILDPKNRHFEARKRRYDDFINFEDTLSSYIDNPEKNKLQRHITEIMEITPQLIKEGSKFKTNYENLRAQQFTQHDRFKTILESLNTAYLGIKVYITQTEDTSLHNIETQYNSFRNRLNKTNIQVIASEIDNYSSSLFNSMTKYQSMINEKVKVVRSIYQRSIITCNIQQKVAKPTLTDALKKKIILQKIPEKSTLTKVLGGIGGFLMLVPFWPVKVLGVAMTGGAAIKDTVDDQDHINIVTENKQNITEKENETAESMKDFVNLLERYVDEECQKMMWILQFNVDFYCSYSEEMEECCERLKIFT